MRAIQSTVVFLPLLQQAFATVTPDEASQIAWRAYGTWIRNALVGGGSLGSSNYVYVTPPTTVGVQAGTVVPDAVTNHQIYPLADVLQLPDEPVYTGVGPSYVESLIDYLSSVRVEMGNPSKSQLKRLDRLESTMTKSTNVFEKYKAKAVEKWLNDEHAQTTKQSFEQWVRRNDRLYMQRKKEMQTAISRYSTFYKQIYKSHEADKLARQLEKLSEFGAFDEWTYHPGYNMPTYPAEYNVELQPWVNNQIEDENLLLYKPYYSMPGVENACDEWFNQTNTQETRWEFDMRKSSSSDWRSLGHSSSVKKTSGGAFSLLASFGGKSKESREVTEFTKWSNSFREQISVVMTLQGPPVAFPVRSGSWDVASARSDYPKLRRGATDNLANKIRIEKVLLGYQPAMTITFGDKETWSYARDFVEKVKKSSGGGLSILGINFGKSRGSSSERHISEIQLTTKGSGGVISIPPGPKEFTYMLGALGKKL